VGSRCKYRFVESGSGGRKMTNQRLRFDVDIGGQWLGVGNQNGDVSMFDLEHEIDVNAEAENGLENGGSVQAFRPTLKFKAHGDAIGSVSFHPLHPLLLSVSGLRHFALPSSRSRPSTYSSHSESSPDSTSESEDSAEQGEGYEDEELSVDHTSVNVIRGPCRSRPYTLDSSVKIWGFSDGDASEYG